MLVPPYCVRAKVHLLKSNYARSASRLTAEYVLEHVRLYFFRSRQNEYVPLRDAQCAHASSAKGLASGHTDCTTFPLVSLIDQNQSILRRI